MIKRDVIVRCPTDGKTSSPLGKGRDGIKVPGACGSTGNDNRPGLAKDESR